MATYKLVALANAAFLVLQSGEVAILANDGLGGDATTVYPTSLGGTNVGYTDSGVATPLGRDRTATNTRFPGAHIILNAAGKCHFKVALAAGANSVTVKLAFGDQAAGRIIYAKIQDSTGDVATIASGVDTTEADAYVDASGAVIHPTSPGDNTGRTNWIASQVPWVGTLQDYFQLELGPPSGTPTGSSSLAYIEIITSAAAVDQPAIKRFANIPGCPGGPPFRSY